MSLLERRLQLLLDADRYDRVAAEAARSGRSVAAVIREAIDLRFPDDEGPTSAAAAQALLVLTDEPDHQPGEGPGELKEAYAVHLDGKVEPR